jgi:hypothetical protein
MQTTRFDNLDFLKIGVEPFLIKDKIIDDIGIAHFDSPVSYSPVYVSFYINYGKAKKADIYIDSKPLAVERNEGYLYLKCISAGVILSSTDNYHELMFECGEKKLAFEVMILKKDGKNLIILKYPMDEKNLDRMDFGVSLKDILNIDLSK